MASQQVVIRLVGENDQLRKSLQEAQRQIRRLEKQVEGIKKNGKGAFQPLGRGATALPGPLGQVQGKLSGVAGGLSMLKSPAGVAAAGVAGVAAAFAGLAEAASFTIGLSKATNRLKAQTGMNVETASAWISIADGYGVSAEKLGTNLTFLSKRIGDATSGSKGATAALEQFAAAGVSEATLRSKDMNRILVETAAGFENMRAIDRTRLAVKLFGRSGRDLLPILSQGKSGVQELQKKMADMGLTIDTKTSKATKKLGGEQRNLNWALKGLKNTLGRELVPAIAAVAAMMSKYAVPALRFFRRWVKAAFTYFGSVAGIVTSLVQGKWGRMWGYIKRTAGALFRIVSAPWRLVLGFLGNVLGRVGRIAGRIGRAMWGGIKAGARGVIGFVKGVFNGIMRTIESGINGIISGVNTAIDILNIKPGPDIGHLGKVRLPRLAEGGIVTRPTVAMIGEAGPEAIVPLKGRNARKAGVLGGDNYFTINTTGPVDELALARSIGWQLATRGLA